MMTTKRTIFFYDGQNLHHSVKEAWWKKGVSPRLYKYTNFDVVTLSNQILTKLPNCHIEQIRFYTGVPSRAQNFFYHHFWTNKLRHLQNQGIKVHKGRISSRGQEKGVDIAIAIDLIKLTYDQGYDAVNIISSDQDFGPAVKLAKQIAKNQGRSLNFYSSSPFESGVFENRGIAGTQWIKFDRKFYEACLDPRDYKGSKKASKP